MVSALGCQGTIHPGCPPPSLLSPVLFPLPIFQILVPPGAPPHILSPPALLLSLSGVSLLGLYPPLTWLLSLERRETGKQIQSAKSWKRIWIHLNNISHLYDAKYASAAECFLLKLCITWVSFGHGDLKSRWWWWGACLFGSIFFFFHGTPFPHPRRFPSGGKEATLKMFSVDTSDLSSF